VLPGFEPSPKTFVLMGNLFVYVGIFFLYCKYFAPQGVFVIEFKGMSQDDKVFFSSLFGRFWGQRMMGTALPIVKDGCFLRMCRKRM